MNAADWPDKELTEIYPDEDSTNCDIVGRIFNI